MSPTKQLIQSPKSGLDQVRDWFTNKNCEIFTFQPDCWQAVQ